MIFRRIWAAIVLLSACGSEPPPFIPRMMPDTGMDSSRADSSTGDAGADATDASDASDCAAACDDGLYCNGVEGCDEMGSCTLGVYPCGERGCDEATDMCTDSICPDSDMDGALDMSCGGTDCDDTDSAISPTGIEVCDRVDQDCDGRSDEGLEEDFFIDADGDSFGTGDAVAVSVCDSTGYADNDSDCDDTNSDVNPLASEICDARDDDCDGRVDEDLVDCECTPTLDGTCGDGIDNDCDGVADEMDECSCDEGAPASAEECDNGIDEDCDGEFDETPCCTRGATEECNGTDDDCDGLVDEAATCEVPGATAVCRAAMCELTGCAPGSLDCNEDPTDGCEADVTDDANNCGACGRRCFDGCVAGICGAETAPSQLAMTERIVCATKESGHVLCSGAASFFQPELISFAQPLPPGCEQLAEGSLFTVCQNPVHLPVTDVVDIVSYNAGFCLLTSDGTVRCWGTRVCEAPGTAICEAEVPALEGAVDLSTNGGTSLCARFSDGSVECLAGRFTSTLAASGVTEFDGDATNYCLTRAGAVECSRATAAGMAAVSMDEVGTIRGYALGAEHGCVATNTGTWCWGRNRFGAIGDGSATGTEVSEPVRVLDMPTDAVFADQYSTCALVGDDAWCWGYRNPAMTTRLRPERDAELDAMEDFVSNNGGRCIRRDARVFCVNNAEPMESWGDGEIRLTTASHCGTEWGPCVDPAQSCFEWTGGTLSCQARRTLVDTGASDIPGTGSEIQTRPVDISFDFDAADATGGTDIDAVVFAAPMGSRVRMRLGSVTDGGSIGPIGSGTIEATPIPRVRFVTLSGPADGEGLYRTLLTTRGAASSVTLEWSP